MATVKQPAHQTSDGGNFDRAMSRMSGQGYRPFCPDRATAESVRCLRHADPAADPGTGWLERASRMDAVIAAFSVGVLLGMAIQ